VFLLAYFESSAGDVLPDIGIYPISLGPRLGIALVLGDFE